MARRYHAPESTGGHEYHEHISDSWARQCLESISELSQRPNRLDTEQAITTSVVLSDKVLGRYSAAYRVFSDSPEVVTSLCEKEKALIPRASVVKEVVDHAARNFSDRQKIGVEDVVTALKTETDALTFLVYGLYLEKEHKIRPQILVNKANRQRIINLHNPFDCVELAVGNLLIRGQ